jgi:hypothetical protein
MLLVMQIHRAFALDRAFKAFGAMVGGFFKAPGDEPQL